MSKKYIIKTSDHSTFWFAILCFVPIMTCLFITHYSSGWAQSDDIPDVIAPPHGFKKSGPPEVYSPQTLYRKINGQAELYLSAGFVALKSQWYESLEEADAMIEVNVYHMGSLFNAFSVFSMQQRADARPTGLASFSYETGNAFYLVHGPYYVELVSSESPSAAIKRITSMAQQFILTTAVKAEEIKEIQLFPLENLVQGSISLISDDAFGFDCLDRVFTAEYTIGNGRAIAYISNRKAPDQAREMVGRLHAYFMNYGAKDIQANVAIEGARLVEVMDTFDLMFSIGEYLAGVHEASDQKQAEKIADMLAETLRENK
jgi:hypothetical protein